MTLLLYEDSFEGLLSALFDAFSLKNCSILKAEDFTGASLFTTYDVKPDVLKNKRLLRGMKKLSETLSSDIYYAWLSEFPDIEDSILNTLRLGFAKKKDPFGMMYADCVKTVESARCKVFSEAHRYLGLVRFHEAAPDIFIADIEPKYRILPVIAEHFHERFKSMRFVIRDLKRKSALVSEPEGFYITWLPENITPLPETGIYEKLWKDYFKTVTIKSRLNPKLQNKFIPLYYRAHLHEFSD